MLFRSRELPRQYWKILTKPGVRAFAEEQGKTEWGIIWSQLLFLTLLAVAVAFINEASGGAHALTTLLSPTSTRSASVPSLFPANLVAIETIALAILAPLLFLAGEGIQYLFAKLFKGNGTYVQQAYNHLLFYVPVQVVTSVLSVLLYLSLASASTNSAILPIVIIVTIIFYLGALGLFVYSLDRKSVV